MPPGTQTDALAEQDQPTEAPPAKRSAGRTLLAIGLALGLGAASAAAGALGYLAPLHRLVVGGPTAWEAGLPIFHPLPELRVPLGPLSELEGPSAASAGRHLRAVVQLEIAPDRMRQVAALQPRIVDTLIAFLHALRERDLATPYGLDRLKAQMLYRVRQIVGEDAVRGVLITEFAIL